MSWEKWWEQTRQTVESTARMAANGPVKEKLQQQIEKSLEVAMELGKQVPSQDELLQVLENKSPHVARLFQNYLDEVSNPHQVGMGLNVVELDHRVCKVLMPHRWRNRTASGAFHTGALTTLAEFTARTYWGQQVSNSVAELKLESMECKFLNLSFRDVTALLSLSGEEREKVLFDLHTQGTAQSQVTVILFGKNEKRIADYHFNWELKSPLMLQEGGR